MKTQHRIIHDAFEEMYGVGNYQYKHFMRNFDKDFHWRFYEAEIDLILKHAFSWELSGQDFGYWLDIDFDLRNYFKTHEA